MIGDIYIAAVPKNRTKWRLKQTDSPKDKILYEGSRQECIKQKNIYNQKRKHGNITNEKMV